MEILTNKHLFERELGNYLFSVPALLGWAKAKGYFLRTAPELDGFGMAQIENVLCAIENAARPNLDDAMEMVAANPRLAMHRMADDAHGCAWLIGAEAHRIWREVFTKAIADGELQIFDSISLLPVSPSPAPSETPDKAAPELTPADWKVAARAIADELHEKDTRAGAHDSLRNIAERVAAEMRTKGIRGPRAPLTGATIAREALQGSKWKRKS